MPYREPARTTTFESPPLQRQRPSLNHHGRGILAACSISYFQFFIQSAMYVWLNKGSFLGTALVHGSVAVMMLYFARQHYVYPEVLPVEMQKPPAEAGGL